ncbi:MAG: insulinase family protein [Bacteroidota bacterium]
MKRIQFIISIILLASISQISFGQMDPTAPLPLDELVRHGVLDNGMTYYIRANKEPKERASFYIIQNVGALLEEDHQNGLAHFLEHMAFNGTEHFPEKGIIDFLERHGVAFGENINAYTSFNETVYNLSDVPVFMPGIVDSSLMILHDWSNYLLLTEKEIDSERGVITEEWRTRRDAGFRMFTASLPYLLPGSKYAKRNIIGDLDVIQNSDYQAIRDFYFKWYRTDLQAIAIVGDFDAVEIENKVIALFSEIPPVKDALERPFFEVPDHEDPVFGFISDKEATQSDITLYIRHRKPVSGPTTLTDLRENYIESLFNSMMDMRISELLQKGNPPFISGGIFYGGFVRGYEVLGVNVSPKPNEEALGLTAILTELERIKRFGFTQGELDRAKASELSRWEKYYKERDKISNEEYIGQYQAHFLEKEAYLDTEFEYGMVQALLPTITIQDFNDKLGKWITDRNRVLIIEGPDGDKFQHLTEAEAFAVFNQVAQADVEPYNEEELAESLISEELSPARITGQKVLKEFDAVEWTLENGARVVYRYADYEKDQVQIRAYSKGGSSLYDDDYVPTTDMLPTLMDYQGVGDFDVSSLQKMLTGKNISLQLSLGDLSEGLNGSASPKDMETLMQLVYLTFNHPRFDSEAQDAIIARYLAFVQNMSNSPQKIMGDSLSLISTSYHPRTRVLNTEYLNEVEFEKMEEVYKDRYADASDFVFVIVGNMPENEVKLLAQTYIGSINDIQRVETWMDRKVYEPEGIVEKTIPMVMETPKANVNIMIKKGMDYSPYNSMVMKVIEGILILRYDETIREEEGGTYGVSLRTSLSRWPVEKATMQIRYDSDPERVSVLKSLVYTELDKLASEGPSEVDLSKTVKNMLKGREESKEHNNYYMEMLYSYYVHGINFNDPANYEDILKGLTPKDVKKVMKVFYKKPNIVDVVFIPQEEKVADQ